MNRAFYFFIITCASFIVAGVLVVFSMKNDPQTSDNQKQEKIIQWSKVLTKWMEKEDGEQSIQFEPFDDTREASLNTPMYVEFWRLSSFLYLSATQKQPDVLSLTGAGLTGVVLGNAPGIISLYDLFNKYTVHDKDGDFRIDQITNGSIYIGREADKRISIYSIDGIVRLTFLSNGQEMTSLLLFPSTYIRFDPSRNRSLQNADLFRTILSLQDADAEVFEYVNPRVNTGEDDKIFNYRLKNSILLFSIFSVVSQQKNPDSDTIKRKYVWSYSSDAPENAWLLNPSKKNHNMLLQLSYSLSRVISSSASDTSGEAKKISAMYKEASGLKLKSATAKTLIEEFLLDGRYALYAGDADKKLQDAYEEIATLIGVQKPDAESRMYQNLSNIYSRNLFTKKKAGVTSTINTFGPTANELVNTLDEGVIQRKEDYFNIAMYALNILQKYKQKDRLFNDGMMQDKVTYSYLDTFFRASFQYIDSISDPKTRQNTVMSFSIQFYDAVLATIVNSLYAEFTSVDGRGIYLKDKYQKNNRVEIPQETLDRIISLKNQVLGIEKKLAISATVSSGSTDENANSRIKKNILRLKGFTDILEKNAYKDYVTSPYFYDTSEKGNVPMVDEKGENILRIDKDVIKQSQFREALQKDPNIKQLLTIWPNLDNTTLEIQGSETYRIVNALSRVSRSENIYNDLSISALYKNDTFSDIQINYDDIVLRVMTAKNEWIPKVQFTLFLSDLRDYLNTVDATLLSLDERPSQVIVNPIRRQIEVNGSTYTVKNWTKSEN